VAQIDLHLRRAVLVVQRVDLQPLRFGKAVDVVEQLLELVHGVIGIGLAGALGAAERPTAVRAGNRDRRSA
jgi:hypothetical protein